MAKPTKFLTDIEIEERAAAVLDRCAPGGSSHTELPVDIDTLTECDFRFKVVWKPIDDPQGCRTYGAMTPLTGDHSYAAELILNENFRSFLSAHPEIERLTRGHELCHWEVHVDEGGLRSGALPFDNAEPPIRFHRANYSENAPSTEQMSRVVRYALTDKRAYRAVKPRVGGAEEFVEPYWMHRQAEHFSACLHVPRLPLYAELETAGDPALYGTHVKLAETFQVSKKVIQIRLRKLGIIEEYEPGRFRNVRNSAGRLVF